MKFKLSRRRKKQYKKDLGTPVLGFRYTKCNWEWYYYRTRVEVRCLEVMLQYPRLVDQAELLTWVQAHAPQNRAALHYARQHRHRWDKFNTNQ